ncbi:hypothetical protein HBH70_108350 [Parastagonospora nodorum]|nr:hypothetical protein HBH54_130770 [Parastagonospora nodorum]KAH3950672.1 hypothetical protein HBH53_071060 [Parastagonospora nodorum]KAH4044540.1 hypothetical protein HBH49_215960 [Parastagonospora nodorum]KAH4072356.1 hypothetical protein HBH50_058620 [Parastagonospora nodorum]KAH4185945.1 hypothetical protein HBH42_169930 [Parastagonospora nodorum]
MLIPPNLLLIYSLSIGQSNLLHPVPIRSRERPQPTLRAPLLVLVILTLLVTLSSILLQSRDGPLLSKTSSFLFGLTCETPHLRVTLRKMSQPVVCRAHCLFELLR